MTSGNFQSFPVARIYVNREKRQRRTLNKIEELAESIRANGLINPPVIRKDGELVAGERRWTAIKLLGWDHMPVQFIDDLPEDELHAVELEENIRRVDLSWQEQCLAVEAYHKLKTSFDATWTSTKTADAIGYSTSTLSEQLAVAKEILANNERVMNAPQYSTAKNIVVRSNARKQQSQVAEALGEPPPEAGKKKVAPLLNVNFHEWAAAYTGPQFNFLHCDFPYGVGMHKSDQGAGKEFGTYKDDKDVYWQLLETLSMNMDTLVSPYAHLMFWFSMDYYQRTYDLLTAMGWKVDKFPLVWSKSDNIGIIPDANRGPRRIYETCFHASRGDRFVVSPVSNSFAAPGGGKELHMNEKPVVMLRHFMRMFVDENTRMLDPTCGSANAVKAAESLGAPTVLGLEKETEFFERARDAYFADA